MKKVYKNSDITFMVDNDRGIKERFIIRFYTVSKTLFIRKTSENVIIKNGKRTIKLNWAELVLIGDGVLNYVVNNLTDDDDFDDHIFNQTFSRTTDYYIASNVIVDEETEESIAETIGDLLSGIRADLTQEISNRQGADENLQSQLQHEASEITNGLAREEQARQQADSALQTGLNETVTVLQGEITSRQREQQFLSQQISNEATQRQQADENLQSQLQHEASEITNGLAREEQARINADNALNSRLTSLSDAMEDKEKVMAYVVSDIYNTLQIFECGYY